MKKLFLTLTLLIGLIVNAQDYESLIVDANTALENRDARKAYDLATKAIEVNSKSNDARWIRAQAAAKSNGSEEKYKTAIEDLKFIANNGGASARIYNAIGIIEQELGNNTYRFKKAKENTGFTDDNSTYVKEQRQIYNDAIIHYQNAIAAFNKSIEIKPDSESELKFKIKDSERYILEIKTAIKELK